MEYRLHRALAAGSRRSAALCALLLLPHVCGALAGTVADGWYHAPQEAFSCPLPPERGSPDIADALEPHYCGVKFAYGDMHYRIDCGLHPGQEDAYWDEPTAQLTDEAAIKRRLLSVHPDWEEPHISIFQWEALEHEGNPLVLVVALVGGSAATTMTNGAGGETALDAVYVCAIYRCFHQFFLSLHDTLVDVLLSNLGPTAETPLAQEAVEPQEVIDDLKGRLLQFSSSITLGAGDYARHIRRAAEEGDFCAVRQMIAAGADVNARDEKGTTALMKAAAEGHAGIARLLLAAGAEVDAAEGGTEYAGWTALMYAAEWDHPELARLLLDAGANPALEARIKQDDKITLTALMITAGVADGKSRLAAMKALLDWGVKADALTLFFVAYKGRVDVLRLMLECGVHPDAPGAAGRTMLMIAARFGQAEAVRMLLEAGADTRVRDERGLSALEHAQANAQHEAAELLLAAQDPPGASR